MEVQDVSDKQAVEVDERVIITDCGDHSYSVEWGNGYPGSWKRSFLHPPPPQSDVYEMVHVRIIAMRMLGGEGKFDGIGFRFKEGGNTYRVSLPKHMLKGLTSE